MEDYFKDSDSKRAGVGWFTRSLPDGEGFPFQQDVGRPMSVPGYDPGGGDRWWDVRAALDVHPRQPRHGHGRSVSPSSPGSQDTHRRSRRHADDAEYDETQYKKDIKGIFSDFARYTSFQGIPYIRKSNRWWSTGFWVLVFLAAFAMSLVQLVDIFQKYYSHDYNTVIDLGYDHLDFPSVTICNMNPIRYYLLEDVHPELYTFIKQYTPSQGNQQPQNMPQDSTGNQGPAANPAAASGGQGPPDNPTGVSGGQAPPDNPTDTNNGQAPPDNPTDTNNGQAPPDNLTDTNNGQAPPDNPTVASGSQTNPYNPTDTSGGQAPPDNPSVTSGGRIAPTDTTGSQAPTDNSGGQATPTETTQSQGPSGSQRSGPQRQGSGNDRQATGGNQGGRQKRQAPRQNGPMQPGNRQPTGNHGPPRYEFRTVSSKRSKSGELRDDFLRMYGEIKWEDRIRIGHQAENMIVDCSFNGFECSHKNFSQWLSPELGNCYTFNSAELLDEPFKAYRSGKASGLELLLYLETAYYVPSVTSGSGVLASIHDFHTMAFPELSGMSVSPGMETSFGMRMVNITRLPYPYGNCSSLETMENDFGVLYTTEACMLTCAHQYIADMCLCYEGPYEAYYTPDILNRVNRCRSESELACVKSRWLEIFQGNDKCRGQCLASCSERRYEIQASNNNWPQKSYSNIIFNTICEVDEVACKEIEPDISENVPANFALLRVYYQDLNFENITQQPDYELSTFASDIGGTLGLWLGMSVLTGVEVIQLLANVIYYLIKKPMRKKNGAQYVHQ